MSYKPEPLFNIWFFVIVGCGMLMLLIGINMSSNPTVTLKTLEWRCAASHVEDVPVTISTGSITVATTTKETICDNWIRRR